MTSILFVTEETTEHYDNGMFSGNQVNTFLKLRLQHEIAQQSRQKGS